MEVGLVGKPNVGKSTLYRSLTLADADVAAFPFTTIAANVGVAYVTGACPCTTHGTACTPQNGMCHAGVRHTPVKLIDVAGLVPGASQGKGLGNQFLDDLRQADVLIHVLDIAGLTNEQGEPAKGHDPEADIRFLTDEIDRWFTGIVERNWRKITGKSRHGTHKLDELLWEAFTGLGVTHAQVASALRAVDVDDADQFTGEKQTQFATTLRQTAKPIILAANKIDCDAAGNYSRLKDAHPLTPVCAEAELTLRNAAAAGLIDYQPGAADYTVVDELTAAQEKALALIQEKVLDVHGSTGVQHCLEQAVYSRLNYITVYPVENEHKLTDGKGQVLPHSHLMPPGSTVRDLAYKIHSDIGERCTGGIDCESGRKVSKDHALSDCDVIKIITSR